ncbi:peptidase M14 carboxypeptidase A [Candidatus Gastranaerophilus sp. (ex Termes propinquus)]|nr:peptidase M14 carboxypeptidase A [Candidatus Gastranaerophilus sp. (ex Termes propinquus)]
MREPKLIIKNYADFEKTILIVGVVHGDEPQGEHFINEYLKHDLKPGKNRVFFIPRLNDCKTRTNANVVDLNRNFPTKNWESSEKNEFWGGEHPGSEPQTRFLIKLIEENNFDAIITIHAPYKIVNYDGEQSLSLAEKIAEILNYPTQEDIGYPTPGSFGTYCGLERGITTVTIEVEEGLGKQKFGLLTKKFFEIFEYLENSY